jgi:hypothetical protein
LLRLCEHAGITTVLKAPRQALAGARAEVTRKAEWPGVERRIGWLLEARNSRAGRSSAPFA